LVGIDTNVLVYASDKASPFHEKAKKLFGSLLESGGVAVTDLMLIEFYAVITDGRKVAAPLLPEKAGYAIERITRAKEFRVCGATIEIIQKALQYAVENNISRYSINDVVIAVTLAENGVETILTKNTKHFKRFPFIEAVDPFEDSGEKKKAEAISFIPYGRQSVDEKDVAAVCSVLRSDWLTTGPEVAKFESAVANYVGAEHGVAVSSGTAALHCAMYALGIGPGDEVVVPPMTFAATANCVVYHGGTPVFADVDQDTLLIDPIEVEKKVTPQTKAIIAVDYAGHPCDYDALQDIAKRRRITLIADGCHALGAEYRGRRVGALAEVTTFSFHPVKHIATGEGGMIVTDKMELVEKLRRFRNHGIVTDHRQREAAGTWHYEMVELGLNYRMTDIQSALGKSQLAKLPDFLERRRQIARRYDDAFCDMERLSPLACRQDAVHAFHLYVVRISGDRGQFFNCIREQGIGANVHYIPVHLHPYYRIRFQTGPGLCPIAEKAYEEIVSLPMHPGMSDEDVMQVIEAVKHCSAKC